MYFLNRSKCVFVLLIAVRVFLCSIYSSQFLKCFNKIQYSDVAWCKNERCSSDRFTFSTISLYFTKSLHLQHLYFTERFARNSPSFTQFIFALHIVVNYFKPVSREHYSCFHVNHLLPCFRLQSHDFFLILLLLYIHLHMSI